MNIIYSLTRNYYPKLKPSITSLLEHNNPRKIYILAEDDELTWELPKCCKVINISGQRFLDPKSPNANTPYTHMSMTRAVYQDILPRVNKVLHLDVDTIICDDLTPVWEVDLKGKWFAAVPEYKGLYNPFKHDKYYNAGVMLMNLKQMRDDNASEKMLGLLNQYYLWCVEQDAFNYFGVPDKVVDLPVRYNESFCCGYTDDPAVVHYAGHRDWWESRSIFRWEYLERYSPHV